jgi:hypothetical protein
MVKSRSSIPQVYSGPLSHYVVLLIAAAILCLPCLLWGVPPGADASLHVMYQSHFSEQFWHGDLYPRWLVNANKGLGTPVFFLQYPLPYFTTALLRPFVWSPAGAQREAREIGVFLFLVIAAAGVAARLWFRKHSSAVASTLAAIVYMLLPYILPQGVYARAALGEVCAFVWMPLALAICDSLRPSVSVVSILGAVLACLFLSNAIIAVLFVPALIFYTIGGGLLTVKAATRRAAILFSALALGVGMSAIYVFPVAAYRALFDWSQMPAHLPGYELGLYFLFLTSGSLAAAPIIVVVLVGTIAFTLAVLGQAWRATVSRTERICICVVLGLALLSMVPNVGPKMIRASGLRLSEIEPYVWFTARTLLGSLCTLGLGILAYCRVADAGARRRDKILLGIALGAVVLMLPWSAPIWKALPVLASIQFPFRFGSILSVAVAGLVALAIDQSVGRMNDVKGRLSLLVMVAAIVWVIGVGFLVWRVDWNFRLALGLPVKGRVEAEAITRVDYTRAVDIPYRTYVATRSVEAFAQRLGTKPGAADRVNDVAATPVENPVRAECVNGEAVVNMRRVGFRELIGVIDCLRDGRVRINQVYWPLWKNVPTGDATGHGVITSSAEGLIEVALPPGRHELHLVLDRAKSEWWGGIVTVVSLLSVIVGCGFVWTVSRYRSRG